MFITIIVITEGPGKKLCAGRRRRRRRRRRSRKVFKLTQ